MPLRNKNKQDTKRTSLSSDFFSDADVKKSSKQLAAKSEKRIKSNRRIFLDSYYSTERDD
jgi:hypothetical protein